jgi:anaerobic selenocysteine-containing dehydrogenase
MVYCHNPVYANGDCKANAQVFADPDKIPFLVSVDVGMSETTMLADLVLPDAVYLERWTCDGKVSPEGVAEYQIRQPIRPPQGESKHFPDVACELAQRLGLNLGFHSAEEFVRAACETTPLIRDVGGFDYMKAHGVWCDLREPEPGKPGDPMKLYSEDLEKAGFPALPSWMSAPEHDTMTDDQLLLITFKVPVQTQSRTQNCKWLSELYHENQAWMHPGTAAKHGLLDGEKAIIRSDIGEITIPIRVTEGIHPNAIAISHHCGHWSQSEYASGLAAPFYKKDADGPLRWWTQHGSHVNRIIPIKGDPIAGGMRWNDTLVRISKAASPGA